MPDWRAIVATHLAGLTAQGPHRITTVRAHEISTEIAAHLDAVYRAAIDAGHTEPEAMAAALRELDTETALTSAIALAERAPLLSAAQGQHHMRRAVTLVSTDFRQALRLLRQRRGASLLAVLAFALGIGLTTSVFSVFYGVLIKPLPYPAADRMVRVFDVQPACGTCPASFTKFVDWQTRNTVFESIAGVSNRSAVLTGMGDAERILVSLTTETVPAVFATPPMIGRWFTAEEAAKGGENVAVLGYLFWKERFAGDPGAVGRDITLDGEPFRVIGVMPPEFMRTQALFKPLHMAPDPRTRGNHFLPVYARLKPGVTVAQAQQRMVALGGELASEFGHNHGIDVQSYPWLVVGNIAPPLRLLMGAVSFVLLIACANIANLLLASGAARRREFAVRASLGATRWDLSRQLLIEGVTLSVAGGALGLLFAQGAVRVFAVMADTIVPRAATVSIDGAVLAFAVVLSVATGVFCGLWPALRLDVRRLASITRQGDTRGGGDHASRRLGQGLVVAEIAIAFALLAGAGLLVKNLVRLQERAIGFTPEGAVTFDLPTSGGRYSDEAAVRRFYDDVMPQLAALPGVTHAGASTQLPMSNFGSNGEVSVEGGNPWSASSAPLVEQACVTPGYFEALDVKIVKGRGLTERDRDGAEPVAVISQAAADRFWPGRDPIGRHVQRSSRADANGSWITVVGVAADVRSFGFDQPTPLQMYLPLAQQPQGMMSVVVRASSGDPMSLMPAVRRVIRQADPLLPVARVRTLDDVIAASVGQPRLISTLAGLFSGIAGLLAAVGVYGVMAYAVRRDRRQFAIRLALGAAPGNVRRAIVSRGLTLGLTGIAIGAAGAWWLTRFVKSMLVDVAPTDPWVFGGVAALLLSVAVGACVWPALSASRTDPIEALRGE